MNVRVRYAPSPTGTPHIGNIRTALFNYLFARNQGGEFLLRIEDTDRARLVLGSVDKIKESLSLLNLKWDGEEHQSKRLELYTKHLEILKEKELAYEDEGAWRFKVEKDKELRWDDVVHGPIKFSSDVIEDFIIIKSDGFPTYHFASVVDDHDMQTSHVFRGDEWISSTPKHLLLYQAFGWDHPQFVHLPPILGPDHKKLSKRQGAKSVTEYIDEGYLPEAIVNFLAFLGWAPKDDEEIFSLQELTREFSLERINKNSPVFNLEKLNWFNQKWIKKLTDEELSQVIAKRFSEYSAQQIKNILPIVKERLITINDFKNLAGFLLTKKIEVDAAQVILNSSQLKKVAQKYQTISPNEWDKTMIGTATTSVMNQEKISKPDMLSSIGIAISGSRITPPIFDSLEKLGKDETIVRLENVIEKKK